jgi:hypothetical protein
VVTTRLLSPRKEAPPFFLTSHFQLCYLLPQQITPHLLASASVTHRWPFSSDAKVARKQDPPHRSTASSLLSSIMAHFSFVLISSSSKNLISARRA